MMATQTFETRAGTRKGYFPWVSWGAIFGGLASAIAVFILLSLLGLAVGFTAIDPAAAEPVGRVPLATGIWTIISVLLAAFVGGYVAARLSGMSRRTDGILHGLVVWGVSTALLIFLVTTTVGTLLGGTFAILGQGAQAIAGAAGGVAASPQAQQQLETMITGTEEGTITAESLSNLQQQLTAGDRQGAISVMVDEMGFTQERAAAVVDQAMILFGTAEQAPAQAREAATAAVEGLTRAAWFLFAALLLSMALGMGGGYAGARATVKRRTPLAV